MNNQPCIVGPTLADLNPNELHYYPCIISLDSCGGSYNTLEDLFSRICVSNKTEGVNLKVFNMIKGINEWKTFVKHTSCKCKCGFGGRKCNSEQKWNNDKYQYEWKKQQ